MTVPVVRRFRLRQVVATVDAVHGARTLEQHPESVKQAAVADRLIITKTDIADGEAVDRLRQRLEAMNPFALITVAVDGELDPALLDNIGPHSVAARSEELGRWLNAVQPESRHQEKGGFLRQRSAPGPSSASTAISPGAMRVASDGWSSAPGPEAGP